MNTILTVSIAAYNVEKYIGKALDSLADDELIGKIEVLIVDDGSKDNTSTIAYQYEKKYPDIFRLIKKENGGYGSTINTSIRRARGKYFKQLDGDDWFEKENLKYYIDYLQNCNADYVLTDYIKIYENKTREGEIIAIKNMTPKKNCRFSEFNCSNDLAMHALTIKTEILKNNDLFIDEHCFYTDVEYDLYPLSYVDSILYLPVVIYCYRIGRAGQSMELRSSVMHYKDHERVCKSLLSFLGEEDWASIADGYYKRTYIEKRLREMIKRQYFLYVLKKYDRDVKKEFLLFDSLVMKYYPEWRSYIRNEKTISLSLIYGGSLYPIVCAFNNLRFRNKL